jgi:hypothetical protein
MIHYHVRCSHAHEFDGWFKDSAGFDRLSRRGLVECPTCGDTKVQRALMAPAVATREALRIPLPAPSPPASQNPEQPQGQSQGQPPQAQPPQAQPSVPTAMTGGAIPDQMRAVLQRMRAEVEKHCDYVGPSFAEEARKIHRGEGEPRAIYGETTPEQAEALSEDGIEFSRIPWVPRADG